MVLNVFGLSVGDRSTVLGLGSGAVGEGVLVLFDVDPSAMLGSWAFS